MRCAWLALLLLAGCTRAPQVEANDAEIAARAATIEAAAQAQVDRQIAELDAETNAAALREAAPANRQ